MRLSPKLMDEVIIEIAGEDVIPLVKVLKNKKNVSEFKLAETIKQEINTTRNMLYRLYHANLVSFTRKKDKKKGWYIYYWTFDTGRVKDLVVILKKKRLERLLDRLDREKSNQFYACDNRCVRLDFDQAMNFEFKCPECGELANQEDNSEKISQIQEEISLIEIDLKDFEKQSQEKSKVIEEPEVEHKKVVKKSKPKKVVKKSKKKKK